MSVRQSRYLRERFYAIGVSKNLAAALSAEVSRFIEESGPEWTVNRLKLLKTGFLRRIAGETYSLPYVATRKDALGPVPKGPFGVLWNATQVSDMTSISKALNCMMVYSTLISEQVTPKQWEKFHDSMCRSEPEQLNVQRVLDSLRIPKWMRVDSSVALEQFERFVVRKGYAPKYVSKALSEFVESDTGMALWEEFPQYKQSFNTLSGPVDSRIRWDDMFGYHPELNSRTTVDPVGRLGVSQEPGYKLRVFANPNICHQVAMSRLKGQLFDLLQKANWDCTFNQSYGTDWVRQQLAQGKKVFSIDLSDATNNFPLVVQLKVLRAIGASEEDVELFHRLSKAPWSSTHEQPSKTYRWTVGQPLGLGPSFAAFALTHGVLVHSIARACRVTDCFRVLGDDIVISEEQVATRYLETMQLLGVPISKDKTICSDSFAEFAGKLVSRDGILAGLKWRQPSDRSFLDVVRLLGPRSFALLTPRQKRVATFMSLLPEPRGFGWNPLGIPLQKRLQVLDAFEELTDEPERNYFPLERRWLKVRLGLEQNYFKLHFKTFPQGSFWDNPTGKASELGSREPTPVGSGMHLLSIAEMTGSNLKLPDRVLTPSFRKELRKRGFITLTPTTDPRGLNPLQGLELKITKLRFNLEQLGLTSLVS